MADPQIWSDMACLELCQLITWLMVKCAAFILVCKRPMKWTVLVRHIHIYMFPRPGSKDEVNPSFSADSDQAFRVGWERILSAALTA
jgi:hypothetical protein